MLIVSCILTAGEECECDKCAVYGLETIEQRNQGEDAKDEVEEPGMSDRICVQPVG